MSLDSIRVNELAKELHLTNKEIIEKFAKLSIVIKSHSNIVTQDQVQKLKNFIAAGSKIEVKKPKAFIVKKVRVEPVAEEAQEAPKADESPRVEIVKKAKEVSTVETEEPREIQEPRPRFADAGRSGEHRILSPVRRPLFPRARGDALALRRDAPPDRPVVR